MSSNPAYEQLQWYPKEKRLQVGKDRHGEVMTVTCSRRGEKLKVKYYCGLEPTRLSIKEVATWEAVLDPPKSKKKKQNRRVRKAWQYKIDQDDSKSDGESESDSQSAEVAVKSGRQSVKRAKSTGKTADVDEPDPKGRKTFALQNIEEAFGARWSFCREPRSRM
ncbi:hypothetical protein K491DRAFT_721121 [Lophiostoma macrostomum CBS 122681]|uniref:Uncharacterized protein n=1 Tax=Lophiostoma macrostomum CBS 122681 TaxID=1314788 RepID=A0A6A6SV14_9PLEO|nr:hypothetical protein K491DRAFT_721121 [Lophiostoma macrostomum CBS 122681]